MEVLKNAQLTQDIFSLQLGGEFPYEEVQAGQFVNLLIGDGKTHPLRRPISVASCSVEKQTLTLIHRVVGEGTLWLSELETSNQVDVLGPLGSGFPLPDEESNILVVGGGVGIPPLYELVKQLVKLNCTIDVVLGYRDRSDIFLVEEFQEFGNVTVCTEDGSKGVKGFVTQSLNNDARWTTLYSCGPLPMLKALKKHFKGKDIIGYVSLEERMACGVGACHGCTVETKDRKATKRVCKEGPVFNWEEIYL